MQNNNSLHIIKKTMLRTIITNNNSNIIWAFPANYFSPHGSRQTWEIYILFLKIILAYKSTFVFYLSKDSEHVWVYQFSTKTKVE